jgi:hypothetical protein
MMTWADGAFQVARAENNHNPPIWSGKDLATLLTIGFEGRFITSEDHPYVQHLRGVA